MATAYTDPARARAAIEAIHRHAEAAGRDPGGIGLQQMLDVPPRDDSGKGFYADLDNVAKRAEAVQRMGFQWGSVNATAIFQSGARSVDAIIETLGALHARLRAAVG